MQDKIKHVGQAPIIEANTCHWDYAEDHLLNVTNCYFTVSTVSTHATIYFNVKIMFTRMKGSIFAKNILLLIVNLS